MGDLISRKALLEAMEKKFDIAIEKKFDNAMDKAFYTVGLSEGFIIVEEIINEQPTIEPPRGEWKKYGNLYFDYECSLCGRLSEFDTPFCQHCGARMKGE